MPSSAEILPLDAFKAKMTFFRMLALGKKSRDRRGEISCQGRGEAGRSPQTVGTFPFGCRLLGGEGEDQSLQNEDTLPGPAPMMPEHSARRKAGPAGAQDL